MDRIDISGITLDAIRDRALSLRPYLSRTPSVRFQTPFLADRFGEKGVALKLECFQHTGSFKARGALSNLMAISDDERQRGVTAASAGNHAIAAAWAARVAGVSAKVVMQNTANPFRIALARGQGADVILKDPGAPTFAEAERLSKDEGRFFIHPFEGVNTSLGTAGVGLEFMEDMPGLEAVVVSVGGGGLISGIAAAVKQINPACKVFGVEPVGADSMSRSLAAGEPVTLPATDTIADSLAPPMALPLGHALCTAYVDRVVTVTDDEICAGMVHLQQEAKLAVEPAAGAAMAGALGPLQPKLQGKAVGLIICGANIDAETYRAQLARGLAYMGA